MSDAAKMKPRRLHSATTLSMVTSSSGTRPGSLGGAVVAGDRVAVRGILAQARLEVRRVLDLVLGAVDFERLVVDVDRRHQPGRDEHGLAEDRRTRVDEQVRAVDIVDDVLHAANAAVHALDGHPVEVRTVGADVVAKAPEVGHAGWIPQDASDERLRAAAPDLALRPRRRRGAGRVEDRARPRRPPGGAELGHLTSATRIP